MACVNLTDRPLPYAVISSVCMALSLNCVCLFYTTEKLLQNITGLNIEILLSEYRHLVKRVGDEDIVSPELRARAHTHTEAEYTD